MSTDTTTTPDLDVAATAGEQIVQIPIGRIDPHPDNVRSNPGEGLADLTRSIKTNGVLQPVVVLPADTGGRHLLVAGHRRRLAAAAAGVGTLPAIVRDLDPLQVLDLMYGENAQRASLSLTDTIRAVARYQALDPNASATKIAKRIGHTPAWVKARLAVAVVPVDVLALLDDGTMSLASVTAVAAVADLGDDTVRACAEHVRAGGRWGDPEQTVAAWRRRRLAEHKRDQLAADLAAKGVTVRTDAVELRAAGAVTTTGHQRSLGLDKAQARRHRLEPCHVFVVTVDRWTDKVDVAEYCTQPRRHKATTTKAAASDLVAAATRPRSDNQQATARRNARKARLAAAPALFTGRLPKQATIIELAARASLLHLGSDAGKLTAAWLGIEADPDRWDHTSALHDWLDHGGDPAAVLLAVAGAAHETYDSASSGLPQRGSRHIGSRLWLDTLTRHAGYDASTDDVPDVTDPDDCGDGSTADGDTIE